MRDWVEETRDLNTVNLVGNHDYNTSDQPSSTWEANRIKEGEFYRICDEYLEKVVKYDSTDNVEAGKYSEIFGYSDNNSQRMRYIFLDSTCVHIPNWSDSNLAISNDQIQWLKDRITELESGWSVVVFIHIMFGGGTESSPALHNIGNQVIAAIDSVYDSAAATVVGVVRGHTHYTGSIITSKGYPVISSTNDGRKDVIYDSITSTQGTTTEQAFDIYFVNTKARTIKTIRIGAGDTSKDRIINY